MNALNDYLLELKEKLEWSDDEMCDRMSVSHKDWTKISNGHKVPTLMAVTRLTESIDVDINHLFKKTIDIPLLSRRLKGNQPEAIPERYSQGTFSRVRTAQSLLDFIEYNFGWRQKQRVMRELHMNEASIFDSNRLINMNFFSDICESMKNIGHGEKFIFQMGRFSVYSNRGGVVGKMFKDCVDPREVYEHLIPILGLFFEKNHDYRILSLGEQHCTIEAKVSEELRDALKVNKIGSLATCHARRGIAGSFALYAGDVETDVTETECIHRGDDRCVYHVEWKSFRLPV